MDSFGRRQSVRGSRLDAIDVAENPAERIFDHVGGQAAVGVGRRKPRLPCGEVFKTSMRLGYGRRNNAFRVRLPARQFSL